uniref:Fe2OG dioxygenase domain-containing protein n=2 Tax=Graphocephala atropunctata TaxID=36148 RepID=A0A1B6M712_9HEMI
MKRNLVDSAPPSVYYIPNFITEFEENIIVEKVNTAPKPKWTQLSNRRLQNWGGIPHPKGMIPEPLPEWLQEFVDRVSHLEVFGRSIKPNHVLINEYLPGQGIMAHFDGPLFYPTVATISCGSHTLLNFIKPPDKDLAQSKEKSFSLLLEPRSLLLLQDSMYHDYQHSIEEVLQDVITESIVNLNQTNENNSLSKVLNRSTRISLTIRHVPKTTKLKLKLCR